MGLFDKNLGERIRGLMKEEENVKCLVRARMADALFKSGVTEQSKIDAQVTDEEVLKTTVEFMTKIEEYGPGDHY